MLVNGNYKWYYISGLYWKNLDIDSVTVCMVYHHCLDGTRYDFLCANYTAFDQKTFICHFVSEVDCVNSKKFWHRNDALYEPTTTTTVKPIIIYQPPAALTPTGAGGGGGNRKPSSSNGRRRRPYRRRRPQYDYYEDEEEADDYYDDEPRYQVTPEPTRTRNKRPRPRPRPVYDDEYEYEDERYDRRGDKRRGMYDDRRRYKEDRRKYDDEYEAEIEDEDRGSEDRVRTKESDRKRRPDSADNPRYDGNSKGSRRRKPTKTNDDYYEEDQERPNRKGASKDPVEDRPIRKSNRENDDTQKSSSNGEKRTRRPINNKPKDDYYPVEDKPIVEQRNRQRQTNKDSASGKKSSRDRLNEPKDSPADDESSLPSRKINDNPPEGVPLVKPSSGSSIYDRPRAAPKIRLPVPKNEQDKYSYKTSTIKTVSVNDKAIDEEYYDEYEEEEPLPKRPSNKPKNEDSRRPYNNNKQGNDRPRDTTKMSASRQRNHSRRPNYDQEEVYQRERPLRNKNVQQDRNRKRPVVEYDEEYEDEEKATKAVVSSKPSRSNGDRFKDDKLRKTTQSSISTSGSTTTTTTSTTTTTPAPEVTTKVSEKKDKAEPAIRIIKRPFLPSRGGSPFAARGLLPVGSKALIQPPLVQSQQFESEPLLKSPPRIQIQPNQSQSQVRQQQSYAQSNKIPFIERNPLDIKEDEYDVTLNDALNPTLPNLPVRNFPPSAFSSPANDYKYGQFRRAPQRDYAEPQVSHSQKQPIRYQDIPQQSSQRYQIPTEPQRYQTVERQQESVQSSQGNQQKFPLPESQSGALNQRLGPQPQPQKYEPASSTFSTKNNREQLVNSNSDYRAQYTHAVPVTYQFRTGPRVTHMHAQPFYTTF